LQLHDQLASGLALKQIVALKDSFWSEHRSGFPGSVVLRYQMELSRNFREELIHCCKHAEPITVDFRQMRIKAGPDMNAESRRTRKWTRPLLRGPVLRRHSRWGRHVRISGIFTFVSATPALFFETESSPDIVQIESSVFCSGILSRNTSL
jgi:hypothetical protein